MKGVLVFMLVLQMMAIVGCEEDSDEVAGGPASSETQGGADDILSVKRNERDSDPRDPILTVKERYEAELMSIPGVVGVGIGERDGDIVIVVMVEERTDLIDKRVPAMLEGYRVIIEETGPIIAL
jgi:hypothetical protein